MPKQQQAQQDNADLLAKRQGEWLLRVRVGILRGGLTDEEWVQLADRDLFRVTRGYMSHRAQRLLEIFNTYSWYRNPRRLRQLHKIMMREFAAVQRIYAQGKLLTLGPGDEEGGVEYVSTLRSPVCLPEAMEQNKNRR